MNDYRASMIIVRDKVEIPVYLTAKVHPAPANEGGGYYVEDIRAYRESDDSEIGLTAKEVERAEAAILRQNS